MKMLLMISVLFLGATPAPAASYLDHGGNTYEFRFTSEALGRAPLWNPQQEENPPLSARKALAVVKQCIGRIAPGLGNEWEFEGLSLVEVHADDFPPSSNNHAWVWCGTFQLRPIGTGSTGYWPRMPCYVLMNGKVLEPNVSANAGWSMFGTNAPPDGLPNGSQPVGSGTNRMSEAVDSRPRPLR